MAERSKEKPLHFLALLKVPLTSKLVDEISAGHDVGKPRLAISTLPATEGRGILVLHVDGSALSEREEKFVRFLATHGSKP